MIKNYYRFLQFLLIMLITGVSFGQSPFVDSTPGSGKKWTVPDNVYSVTVQIWGAGGAGGGAKKNSNAGSGGGGGGYTTETFSVLPGDIINYTVGKGGDGSFGNGGNGTSTTLSNPSIGTLNAGGGKGGIQRNGMNNIGGEGGVATGGNPTDGHSGESTNNSGYPGGDGGKSPNGGNGGNGYSNSNGEDGKAPGNGGAGGEHTDDYWVLFIKFKGEPRSGGNGGDGRVRITYTKISNPTITNFTPNNACSNSGTSVTITGTNFNGASSVSINGAKAIHSVNVAGNIITATFPTNTTSGLIKVNTPVGEVISNSRFTVIPFKSAVASNTTSINTCSDTTIRLKGNHAGIWTAVPRTPGSLFSFANDTDPNADFIGESGTTYDITWTIQNPPPCAADSVTFEVVFPSCDDNINFNGINNYVNLKNEFDFSTDFSIELWIKRNNTDISKQTLLSKRHANDLTSGYDLSLIDGKLTFKWNDNDGIQSPQTLSDSRWYHVAVTYNSDIYSLYIDGIEVISQTGALPQINSFSALLGATGKASDIPIEYYEGSMDEVRIWKKALTKEQIREMMNQEIEKNGLNAVRGSVLKLDINGLNWSDLMGYYQMNQGTTDITAGKLADNSESGNTGSLNNMNSMQLQSAPLPYVSRAAGEWNTPATWLDGDVQQIPNSAGVNDTLVDWNIVRTSYNVIAQDKDLKVLGLLIDAETFTIKNSDPHDGQGLEVTRYLNIADGATLKLVGESQLLQRGGSILGEGIGVLQRDQQGTGNMFNYNYWGSPVFTAGMEGTRTYTIKEVLFDGDVNERVNWASSLNVPISTPISISNRWLYIYDNNPEGVYEDWQRITQNTTIKAGLGYLMKGGGNFNALDKNYTFKGRPNNGTIAVSIGGPNKTTVVGNPYPSAIDADKFFDDNRGTLLEGSALIFWEQSPYSATHVLKQYQGRYAYYTKSGGVPAVSPPGIKNPGTSEKEPGRYIPVAQGFFVMGSAVGGDIIFNNSQREFVKELDSESIFLRDSEYNNEPLSKSENPKKKIIQRVRLEFKTPDKAIRPLLLAFTQNNEATDGIDYGYDALNYDDFPNDLSFSIENKKFVIQGVGSYDINKKYLLDMNLGVSGMVKIELTSLENFETPIDVFIHDAAIDTYTKINNGNFQLQLEKGNYTDRFSIVFKENKTLATIDNDFKEIQVKYLQKTAEIYVKTPASVEVRQVYLINMVGQVVKSWNRTNMNSSDEFKILVKDIPSGNYILKVETNTSSFNKKIIVGF